MCINCRSQKKKAKYVEIVEHTDCLEMDASTHNYNLIKETLQINERG